MSRPLPIVRRGGLPYHLVILSLLLMGCRPSAAPRRDGRARRPTIAVETVMDTKFSPGRKQIVEALKAGDSARVQQEAEKIVEAAETIRGARRDPAWGRDLDGLVAAARAVAAAAKAQDLGEASAKFPEIPRACNACHSDHRVRVRVPEAEQPSGSG